MKKYKSHKTVEAGRIDNVVALADRPTCIVILDDKREYEVPTSTFNRGMPKTGDYLVRYSDGYISWSPAKAFEEGYAEDGEHKGLPVAGYRAQSSANVETVNINKEMEERLLRHLDLMAQIEAYDKRWLAIGRTQLEQAFMAINRAVFKPERVKLS